MRLSRFQARPGRLTRLFSIFFAICLLAGTAVTPANATISFVKDDNGAVEVPTETSCPTFSKAPRYFEAWTNADDMELRGYLDPKNQTSWSFASRMAQVICGAKQGSTIKLGFYFIRALGTMTTLSLGSRPESDAEAIWDAIEYVHKNRGVQVSIIVDASADYGIQWTQINQRLVKTGIATVLRCFNGCLNTNNPSRFPSSINHEKYIAISDTTWPNSAPGPHPLIMQSSGNIARSQIRTYLQEVSVIYDDHRMYDLITARHTDMTYCAKTGCSGSSGFSPEMTLVKQRGIWVDPIYRHGTDADRGTMISFSPQPQSAMDYYVSQFDDVDCAVDNQIRIAMFKLTDSKALRMVESLIRLKRKGCDIQLLMSRSIGSYVFSTAVRDRLKTYAIPFSCSPIPMHTKLILIGPRHNNNGRILVGTANMSTSGLRYNEEHVLTIDSRRSADPYTEDIRRVYGDYMNAFNEISEGGRACK